MPVRKPRRTSSPSSPARSKVVAAAPRRPLALTDAAADVGDLFEETLLETLARDDERGWKAGPVVALGMDRLAAGHLGWTTTLTAPGSARVGSLHLIVVPGASRQAPKQIPLTDARWGEFAAVEHSAGPPRLLLLARSMDASQTSSVRQLSRTLFSELTGELAPERRRGAGRA